MSKKTKLLATLLVMAQMITLPGNSIVAKAETNTDNNVVFEDEINDFARDIDKNSNSNHQFQFMSEPTEEDLKRAAENSMTLEELEYYTGKKQTRDNQYVVEANEKEAVDLLATGYMPPEASQIGGTCWAYSAVYYQATYEYNKVNNIKASKLEADALSPLFVHNLHNSEPNSGGAFAWDAYKVLSEIGAPEVKYADKYIDRTKNIGNGNYYLNWCADFDIWKNAMQHRAVGYYKYDVSNNITDEELATLKQVLDDGSVLSFETQMWYLQNTEHFIDMPTEEKIEDFPVVSEDGKEIKFRKSNSDHIGEKISYASRKAKVFKDGKWEDDDAGYHQVTIVGYDDNICVDISGDGKIQPDERGAFKVLNSWGNAHNGKPYFWVSYDAFRMNSKVLPEPKEKVPYTKSKAACLNDLYRLVYDKNTRNNSAYLKLTLATESRRDLGVTISNGEKSFTFRSGYRDDVKIEIINNIPVITEIFNYSVFGNLNKNEEGTIIIPLDDIYSYSKIEQSNNKFEKLTYEDIKNGNWTITIEDKYSNGKPIVVKNLEFIDEDSKMDVTRFVDKSTNKYQTVSSSNPITLDGQKIQLKPLESIKVSSKTFNTSKGQVGKEVKLDVAYNCSESQFDKVIFIAQGGNYPFGMKDKYFTMTSKSSGKWVPDMDGTYKIFVDITADGKTTRNYIGDYYVDEKAPTEVTIYYKGYNNPNIHYKVGNGSWTTVPGIKMSTSTTLSNCPYEFSLDLGNQTELTACFNDGNNNWQNNNRNNYTFKAGKYYTVIDGVMREIAKPDKSLKINELNTTFSQCTVNGTVGISASVSNATGTVNYKFTATDSNGNVKVIKDYSTASSTTWRATAAGTYTLKVEAKDSTNKVVSKSKTFKVVNLPTGTGTFDKQSPQNLGSTIKVNVNGTGGTGTLQYQLIAQGGNYQYGGKEIYVQKFSTNKSISWTPEVDGNYTLMLDIKDETGAINRVSLGHYIISKNFGVSSFTADKASPQAVGKAIGLTAQVKNATGTVQYQFTAQKSGSSASVIQSYSTKNTCYWYPGLTGTYTLTVSAKDSTGKVVTKTMSYQIKTPVGITSVSVDKQSPQEANTTINIKVNTRDGIGTIQYRYSFLSWNGVKTVLKDYSTSSTFAWTPKESMLGFLYVEVKDASGNSPSTYQMDYSITPATVKMTTIYYKGYSNPYIHYKIGNGTWTTAPGMKMSSNSDVDGYDYAITINLGQADKLTACFNNGSGAWDNNNGSDYIFGAGYYTFSNGKITKIEKPSKELKINSITCSSGSTIKMGSTVNLTVNASGGQGPYTYSLYYYGYGSGRLNYILKETSTNTATFTPDYPRDTTLYAEVVDSTGKKVTYSQVFNVKEITSNKVTIYYRGVSNAYIHYQKPDGTWTKAPGEKMKLETSGYYTAGYYSITLDIGTATKLKCCFNNGGSQWDNNGGNDYTIETNTANKTVYIRNGVIQTHPF